MIFIDHQSTDANFNFALEKYVMETLDIADAYFLFWRTSPTLMVGRFQNTPAEINMDFAEKNNINIVRRITGGGTIYTDMGGWQFSFITKNPVGKNIDFAHFTAPVIDALASVGVRASLSGRNDLLVDGKKISGNAQYKNNQVNLHHGSLLYDTNLDQLVRALNPDDEKIIAKGIKSVRQRVTNIIDYMPKKLSSVAFAELMIDFLTRDMETYHLSDADISAVNQIKAVQFDTWEWNFGKSPQFNIAKENRFAGGKLSVSVEVTGGIIKDIAFYGDFFAQGDLEQLKCALIDVRYTPAAVRSVLERANAGQMIYQISLEDILSVII